MAELHESIVRSFRKKIKKRGFREARSPMPTYRPDIFGQKMVGTRIVEEVVVEAEIESTLFNDHTVEQLVLMDQYIHHQMRRRIKIQAILLVPNTKVARLRASLLLASTFPKGAKIKLNTSNGK